MKSIARLAPPVLTFIIAIAAMEAAVRLFGVRTYLLPPPSQIVHTFFADGRELWGAFVQTSEGALSGFGLSAATGLIIAVALSSSAWVQRAFYPYAVFFQTVPIIAIAPLLVIWCGYGMPTVIASAFIVSIFPMIANTLSGLRSTESSLRDLFRLYGASRTATLLKLRLPFALPNIMTGLQITAGLAVIGAVVGEFIGGGGLGSVIDVARTQQRTDKVFAAVLLASLLGLALFALVSLASRLTLRRWHESER
ncbi:MAG TPA: ABC transporter permease [Humisphaera sp.]|jgi:NitT/TauT family transport system permease protein|nr:ABC transporter permease [Humisphaera sp.]